MNLRGVLDLLFPPVCVGCNRLGNYLCNTCRGSILFKQNIDNLYLDSVDKIYFLDTDKNSLIRKLITRFKYGMQKDICKILGELLNNLIEKENLKNEYFVLVPTTRRRLWKRGFYPLAEIAKSSGVTICDLIKSKKDYKRQQTLNKNERLNNLDNVFDFNSNVKIPNRIILFDDVLTTGVTINSLAKFLKGIGVKKIIAVVLVKA